MESLRDIFKVYVLNPHNILANLVAAAVWVTAMVGMLG